MLPLFEISVEKFGISHRNGFLPDELPLQYLPDPCYQPWEVVVTNLPALIKDHRIRDKINNLPVLSTSKLSTEREWQRAYVLLSLFTHSYIWGGERPSEILPPAITRPFLEVAAHFDLPPTATYAALNLWNFKSSSTNDDLCNPDSIASLHTFTGKDDESWFYSISVAMEARGGSIIPTMLRAISGAVANDTRTVSQCLIALANCLRDLGILLERMYERCDPQVFYHEIRPMLAGSKNMAVAGLPKGVFYDEGNGKGEWRQYSGGSNAQSSLIQFFDIVLGVEHHATGDVATAAAKKNAFIQEMRKYMPGPHRQLLEQLSSTVIREFVLSHNAGDAIIEDYNSAVAMLTVFREKHIQIVTRYIILPSKMIRPKTNSQGDREQRKLNLAVASTLKFSKGSGRPALQGTGGTKLIPFLKQTRDETKLVAIFAPES